MKTIVKFRRSSRAYLQHFQHFRRIVADHLGGTYECITGDEIPLVAKTNVVSERDFAQLDRLLR